MRKFASSVRRPRHTSEMQPYRLPQARVLRERRHTDLARRPRLRERLAQRPPYLEAAVTGAAFLFLLFVILGGV